MTLMQVLAIISGGLLILTIIVMLICQFYEVQKFKHIGLISSLFLITITMLLAYRTYFGESSDMYRYYQMLDEMKEKKFSWVLQNGLYKENLITSFLFWIIAKTGDYQLLPCISAGFTIACICYIVLLENKRNSIKTIVVCIFILQIISISGMRVILGCARQNMMMAIFAVALYRDYIAKKKNIITILLYVAACMIHSAAVFLIVIRLCAVIKGKVKILFICWTLLIPFADIFVGGGGVVESAIYKLYDYQEISDVDERYYIVQLAMFILIMWRYIEVKRKKHSSRYLNFFSTFIIFSFGAIPILHLFLRQIIACMYISLPLLIDFNEIASYNKWKTSTVIGAFLMVGLFAYETVFMVNYWQLV